MKKSEKAYFTDYEGRGQTIVLLHGFLSSSTYWTKLQPLLTAAGFRVVTIDLLGFGLAPKPKTSRYGYEEHITHIKNTVKHIGINKPFILIGHSMGALLASRYATEYSTQVSSTILIHPPLYKDIKEAHDTLRATGKLYRFLLDSKYRRFGWVLVKTLLTYRIGKHTHHSRDRSLKNVIEVAEILDELEVSKVNALLIVGTKDRQEYLKNIKEATLSRHVTVVSEDVTHHSPIKNPLMVQRMIIDFLSK